MEFSETNLPFEKPIFFAFNAQARVNVFQKQNENHPVLMAQLLNTVTGGEDPSLIAQAFLGFVPEAGYGVLQNRFGKDAMDVSREISKHMRTGFAYIEEAGQQAQAFAAAHVIALIMEFDLAVDTAIRENNAFEALGAKGLQEQKRPNVPSLKFINHVAKLKTGIDALDWLLQEKVESFNNNIEDKLDAIGLTMVPPQDFVPFRQTGLLDDPKVERAYTTMITDPRATRYNVALAMDTAGLLGAMPSTRNSTAIAAALLDIGLSSRGQEDMDFLQSRVDWDVLDLVARHSVSRIRSAAEIMTAPVEFRQMAVASSIVTMTYALEEGKHALDELAKDEKPSPAAPYVKQHALSVLKSRAQVAEVLTGPAAGLAESDELRALFNTKLKELNEFVTANTPKPQLLLTGPAANDPGPQKKPKATGVNL